MRRITSSGNKFIHSLQAGIIRANFFVQIEKASEGAKGILATDFAD